MYLHTLCCQWDMGVFQRPMCGDLVSSLALVEAAQDSTGDTNTYGMIKAAFPFFPCFACTHVHLCRQARVHTEVRWIWNNLSSFILFKSGLLNPGLANTLRLEPLVSGISTVEARIRSGLSCLPGTNVVLGIGTPTLLTTKQVSTESPVQPLFC